MTPTVEWRLEWWVEWQLKYKMENGGCRAYSALCGVPALAWATGRSGVGVWHAYIECCASWCRPAASRTGVRSRKIEHRQFAERRLVHPEVVVLDVTRHDEPLCAQVGLACFYEMEGGMARR